MHILEERGKKVIALKKKIISGLGKVQRLSIKRVLKGGQVVFQINSHAHSAMLQLEDIKCGHELNLVRFSHYDFMTYDRDDSIVEFYEKQLVIVDKWIVLLR